MGKKFDKTATSFFGTIVLLALGLFGSCKASRMAWNGVRENHSFVLAGLAAAVAFLSISIFLIYIWSSACEREEVRKLLKKHFEVFEKALETQRMGLSSGQNCVREATDAVNSNLKELSSL